MSKVLVVTNPYMPAMLHITPLTNKDYYQSQNQLNPDKKYTFKEMEEVDAEKFIKDNLGIDPDFKSPKQTAAVIADKEAEIKDLRAKLEESQSKDVEMQKLRDQLAALSTKSTSPENDYSKEATKDIKEAATATAKK